jgi:hypothetical protein
LNGVARGGRITIIGSVDGEIIVELMGHIGKKKR